MNNQPYGLSPRRWSPKLSPFVVRLTRRYRRRKLRREQQIQHVQVVGGQHLLQALQAGHGTMIVPNHSAHYDSAALYLAADQLDVPLYFMTAWQVFAMSRRWEVRLMQRLGCFSINRECSDQQAFKQAIEILQHRKHPLVIFPEGDIYHVTDRVTPFREGAAAVALAAARRSTRPVSVIPCGIRFQYVQDPLPNLQRVMTQLEQRLFLRSDPTQPLSDRIYRFAESLIALKEIDYMGQPRPGALSERIGHLSEFLLLRQEHQFDIQPRDRAVPERVTELRNRNLAHADQLRTQGKHEQAQRSLQQAMEDLFLVMQLYSYPGNYLRNQPSVERLAETIDKFEEDVLGREIPSVHGRRRVEVRFGEPIPVAGKPGRAAVGQLTGQMQDSVQTLVDQIRDAQVLSTTGR